MAKRFIIFKYTDEKTALLEDGKILLWSDSVEDARIVKDRLNGLYEENQQLQSKINLIELKGNKELQNQVDSLRTSQRELMMQNIFLEKELNRLKEENKKLKIGIAISDRWEK